MKNYLLELDISETDVLEIIKINNNLTDYDDYKKNIEILKMIDCSDSEIKNIIISNPNILIRNSDELIKLINCLTNYGFTNLNSLFDSIPELLSKDDYEIVNYFNDRKKEGLLEDDTIDLIENGNIN